MLPATGSDALRDAVRAARMHTGDALIAADSVIKELDFAQATLDILRRANPALVAAAEIEALAR